MVAADAEETIPDEGATAGVAGTCWVLGEGTLAAGVAIPAAESTEIVSPSAPIVVSGAGGSGAGALGTTATCATGSAGTDSFAAERVRYCHTPSAATAMTAAIPPTIPSDGAEDDDALVPQNRHPPRERG